MSDEFTPQSAQPLERRLATILCADIAGYSKMMASNEELTVRVFRGHREIFESLINLHRGRIFNTAGDALLAEFNSPVEAVRCATEIQAALRTRNEHLPSDEKMQFRIGINLGDVIIQGNDLLGDGVNIAARIQTATAPGGICISGSVHDQIQNKLSLDFKLLGDQTYKNIAKPVRTYTINEGSAAVTPARRPGWRMLAALTVAVLAIAGASYWGYLQYDAHRIEQLQADERLAAQKQAAEQAQQAAEKANLEMQLQAKKLAAEEELRHAQEERNRVEQDRKQLEAEKRAAEAAKRQAEQERKRIEAAASAPAAPPATTKDAPKSVATYDGTYNGQLCNLFAVPGDKAPGCWRVTLMVRSGIVEGSWVTKSQKRAKAHGSIAEDGSVKLNLVGWALNDTPVEAILTGRIIEGAISASGQWSRGGSVKGEWKRYP